MVNFRFSKQQKTKIKRILAKVKNLNQSARLLKLTLAIEFQNKKEVV